MRRPLLVARPGVIGLHLGSTVFPATVLEVARTGLTDPTTCREHRTKWLGTRTPMTIALLGVVTMTGVWPLAAFKQWLGRPTVEETVGLTLALALIATLARCGLKS